MSIEIIRNTNNNDKTDIISELYDILVDIIIIQNEGGLNEENDGGTLACKYKYARVKFTAREH